MLPSPPLLWSKTDKVVVHGPKMSPAVNKTRTYLVRIVLYHYTVICLLTLTRTSFNSNTAPHPEKTFAGIAYKHKAHLPSGIRSGPYTKDPTLMLLEGRSMTLTSFFSYWFPSWTKIW